MRQFRWVLGVVVLGLAGALVGVVPDGVSAVPARSRCRATAFVANTGSNSVSTIDLKTMTKQPTDIAVGTTPVGVTITPNGKTVFVGNRDSGTVSTIDVKTRTKNPTDIPVGPRPAGAVFTPDGRTAFVTNGLLAPGPIVPGSDTVSTIDVKTRTKDPTDITVGRLPALEAVTPDGRTVFVANLGGDTVSTIDVQTRTKNPTDIPVGQGPAGIAITPDGKTAFVANSGNYGATPFPLGNSVSTIDVQTRTKNPTDIPVGTGPAGVAITPDGKTAFVANQGGSVSTIDVKTRTKHPDDITVGVQPGGVAITPDGKTAFVTDFLGGKVSTIDAKTRTKHPTDINVGANPTGVAVTPCRR
jgi:YVTN family beta-propeller protein